jgi:tripartite-type tricarboxylate transporter receptor subunit TctC
MTTWSTRGIAAVSLTFSALAYAQAQQAPYPDRPIKLVVGFAAGGPTDIVARVFSEHASQELHQPVVENRPGSNATLATEAVAVSPADGHTLLVAATNHTMIPALYAGRVKFDALASFRPVCTLASTATVLVVGPSLPVRNMAAFLATARAKPGALSYATPGIGSSPHLAAARLAKLTNTLFVHIPYRGAAPGMADLTGGLVDMSLATVGSVLPYLKSGKLTALAVASRQRSALLTQVPTFEEAGVKGYIVDTWYGLLAPAATPAGVVHALERQASAFGRSDAVRERLLAAGLEPDVRCGEPFAAQIKREVQANTQLVKALDLKAE